jgi:DNA-binding response OmpR family regulator
VLVASAEPELRHRLAADLIEFGLWLTAARPDAALLEELRRRSVDLLVLEWREGAARLLEAVRLQSAAPVIVLVPSTERGAAVAAFDAGADDVVTAPWSATELGRRIEAMLRRVRPAADGTLTGPEGVRVHPRAHEAYVEETPLDLTPTEFVLLERLLTHRGEVLTADELATSIWGHETFGARNFVEAHVSRLRGKRRAARAEGVITTVGGVGYKVR